MIGLAAMASNRVIGVDGKLPWRIPGDMAFFKKMTAGKTMVMGRKTYDSLPPKFNLGDRKVIVLTTKSAGVSADEKVTHISYPCGFPDDAVVCGGSEIYRLLLPRCKDFYLTRVSKAYEGDAFMPSFDNLFKQWDVIERTPEYIIVHYKNINPL